jgi:bacillolysin
MRSRAAVLVWSAILSSVGASAQAQPPSSDEFLALSGEEAAAFVVPDDMELVKSFPSGGLTYERYQQRFGPLRAEVLGGQITLYRRADGVIATVVGAHFASIIPLNAARLSAAQARGVVDRDFGSTGNRNVDLLIDPADGRYFFRVESRGFARRWLHWIDAEDGRILKKLDAIQTDHGLGVKGDTKDLNGPNNSSTADDLTTFHNRRGHGASGKHWDLFSNDNRQKTYDARNGTLFLYYTTDADNHWLTFTSNRRSPGQPALVDAQYYANLTDDYLQGRHQFNWKNCYSAMQSAAHFSLNYNNAFWDGTYTIYGDGDGVIFRELSGGLDVVAHENTHAVTDCTSNLIYQNESGALNESFSDILGNSAEFYAAEPTSSNCVRASGQASCADWWIGEDVYLPADSVPGFRNMADPSEDGDPDHHSERYTGTEDNGGVHTNSGIPNHAFYLLVNGGANAGDGKPGHSHSNGPVVAAIGLADAERVFFQAFTALPTNATMCDARAGTEASASSLFGANSPQVQSVRDAWTAVGVICP